MEEKIRNEEMQEECHCDNNCTCGENCECNEEHRCSDDCTCNNECNCGEECNCENDCECDDECCCGHDCDCDDECDCDESCSCEEDVKKNKKDKKKKKDKHEDKLNEAYNMISSLEDKLLREKAEMINYRRRKDEETNRMLKYANEDIAKELLEVVDNFERAIDYDDEDASEEVKKFLSGFKMIYCNLQSILERFEIKAIDGKEKPFDPTYHQAVMTEKVEGMEAGMVVDVLRKGYMLKDKVIRPAMVKVSE